MKCEISLIYGTVLSQQGGMGLYTSLSPGFGSPQTMKLSPAPFFYSGRAREGGPAHEIEHQRKDIKYEPR